MRRFTDKVALVTGAGSGIGAATARRLAAEGASLILAGRTLESLTSVAESIAADGGTAMSVVTDVTVPESAEAAVAAGVERYGRLDVVFNNAGVIFRERDAPSTTVEEWDLTMDVSAKGTFLVSKYAIPVMVGGDGGAIVNNASYFGLVGGRGTAAYSAAKGAVVLLTKSMAIDHAADGIRVNCICAGSVDTPMLQREMLEMGGTEAVRHLFEAKHPLGRIASPDEIAAAVAYLASDEAAFVTGVALPVDGGLTAG